MAAKSQWAKSTNGPDWTDIETLMRAISALHTGHVNVAFSPRGIGSSGGLHIALSILLDVLPGSSLPAVIMAESEWPCAENHDLCAHVFEGLYQLDYQVGEVYKQEELWK